MLYTYLHIACALQITEDSKGSWGEVHFVHLLLIKESKLILRSLHWEGQGLHPSPAKQEAWHEVHRLLPKVIDARRCLNHVSVQKTRSPSSQWKEQRMMIYFGDFRFHWFSICANFNKCSESLGLGDSKTDMLGNNALGGLLVISRLEVLGTMFPWQAHKLSALPLSHRLQNMRVNTHPAANMIPCYRGLVPFHIVKDDPMQLSAALGLQVRKGCFWMTRFHCPRRLLWLFFCFCMDLGPGDPFCPGRFQEDGMETDPQDAA